MKEKKIPPVGRYPLSILMAAGINLALEAEEEAEKALNNRSIEGGKQYEEINELDDDSTDCLYDDGMRPEGIQPRAEQV
ncbi:MAG: hypothetical protein IJM90_07835 [Firmicutes bacterium]|nr:hypothetical protein [Bacillota bacterium]